MKTINYRFVSNYFRLFIIGFTFVVCLASVQLIKAQSAADGFDPNAKERVVAKVIQSDGVDCQIRF